MSTYANFWCLDPNTANPHLNLFLLNPHPHPKEPKMREKFFFLFKDP
jgi:hypothetical protein